jgi:transposase
MQIKHFIGIDVSKDTLDLSVVVDGKSLQHYCIKNRTVEIKSTINKIMKALGATVDDMIFCMEHTGMYNLPLVKWLQSQQGKMWLESGVHIRKNIRGRSWKER